MKLLLLLILLIAITSLKKHTMMRMIGNVKTGNINGS